MQASERLRDAAQILGQSPGSLQLRYLQTLVTVANENDSSSIIFPLPMEILRAFGYSEDQGDSQAASMASSTEAGGGRSG